MTLITCVPGRRVLDQRGVGERRDRRLDDRGVRIAAVLGRSWARSVASMPGAIQDATAQRLGSVRRPGRRGSPGERLTLATCPVCGCCLPATAGSGQRRPVGRRVRPLRAMPATTARAVISSPPASTTPSPSRHGGDGGTSASVRISTPASRAAASSAAAERARAAAGEDRRPAAPPSLPAESASRTAVVPADHGPIDVYWTPRQAIAAWSASVRTIRPRSRRSPSAGRG